MVDGAPDDFKIDLEVAMRQDITHLVSKSPRYLRVTVGVGGKLFCHVITSRTDDFEIADYRVLVRRSIKKATSFMSST